MNLDIDVVLLLVGIPNDVGVGLVLGALANGKDSVGYVEVVIRWLKVGDIGTLTDHRGVVKVNVF